MIGSRAKFAVELLAVRSVLQLYPSKSAVTFSPLRLRLRAFLRLVVLLKKRRRQRLLRLRLVLNQCAGLV
jgi:hypothetical protein